MGDVQELPRAIGQAGHFPAEEGADPEEGAGSWHKGSAGVPGEEQLGHPRAVGNRHVDGRGNVVGTTAGAVPSPAVPSAE